MPDKFRLPPLTYNEFDELVARSELPVLLYVTRTSCKITDYARREFLIVAQELASSVAIYEVDATEKALISRLDVKAVPILLFFTSGVEKMALLGFHSADELRKRLWSIISTGDAS